MRYMPISIALLWLALVSSSFNASCDNSTACPDNQECIVGLCAPVQCDCGFVGNHSCTHYQCCSDSQCTFVQHCEGHLCALRPECAPPNVCCADDDGCADNQSCADGLCAPVQCECGAVQNHQCLPYRCCSSSQCAANENCINNTCVLKSAEQCMPPDCCVSDSQCADGEQCAVGKCAFVECSCGAARNHICVPYPCCEDSDCGAGENCLSHACVPKPPRECAPPGCCVSDLQCSGTQRCAIVAGAKNGTCVDVVGCGVIANHTIVQAWECDDLAACPACQEGGCVDHRCITAEISAPTSVSQGGATRLRILVQRQVCGDCGIVVSSPSGGRFNIEMDDDGQVSLLVSEAGTYQVSVLKKGVPLKTVSIKSLAKTPGGQDGNATSPPTPAKGDSSLPIIIAAFVVVVLAGVAALIYLANKEK